MFGETCGPDIKTPLGNMSTYAVGPWPAPGKVEKSARAQWFELETAAVQRGHTHMTCCGPAHAKYIIS